MVNSVSRVRWAMGEQNGAMGHHRMTATAPEAPVRTLLSHIGCQGQEASCSQQLWSTEKLMGPEVTGRRE